MVKKNFVPLSGFFFYVSSPSYIDNRYLTAPLYMTSCIVLH